MKTVKMKIKERRANSIFNKRKREVQRLQPEDTHVKTHGGRGYNAGGVVNSGRAWLQGLVTMVTLAASGTKWNKLARLMHVCRNAQRTRGVRHRWECYVRV